MIAQSEITVTETDLARLREMTRDLRANKHPLRQYAAGLEDELARARIIPAAGVPPDVVTMNSRVRIRDQRRRSTEILTLVYPRDANGVDGRVSILAPLGLALLGARAGDTISWVVPAGLRTFIVDAVLYQPESAGHRHL
ncbi:MAG TPA: nucleoside diphosphate kinase regulator [Tepidisphaeraceae bacterium]|nr:nucleoside diphosphate kinase regulator [Tepidisphaeraceae bacterium]